MSKSLDITLRVAEKKVSARAADLHALHQNKYTPLNCLSTYTRTPAADDAVHSHSVWWLV